MHETAEIVYYISRRNALIKLLICIGFVLLGLWMLQTEPTQNIYKFYLAFVGLLSIIYFGAYALVAALNVIFPSRLIIGSQGFALHRPLLPKKSFAWNNIERFWLTGSAPFQLIAWIDVAAPDNLGNAWRGITRLSALITKSQSAKGYDGYLPWGWALEPKDLLVVMQQAHKPPLADMRAIP